MTLCMTLRRATSVPLEVEGITPDVTAGKTLAEIERMPVYEGNVQAALGDFFQVQGDPSDRRHRWEGDLRGVHWIGAGMTDGQIVIEGSAGRHVGSQMRGGTILVLGDVSDWVGAEMRGGLIRVQGRAGHLVGSAYRGSPRGMTGGTICIAGDAGNEIGHSLRRGLIAIGGGIGDLAGMNMLAGSILVFGDCGIRHGAGMRRGTLAFFGAAPPLLPTFRHACRFQPVILRVIFRYLRQVGFAVPEAIETARCDLYHGDFLCGGRGEVLLRAV